MAGEPCIRGSFSIRTWMRVGAVLVATLSLGSLTKYTRRPANVRPIGGNWHVVVVPHPGEIDTVFYSRAILVCAWSARPRIKNDICHAEARRPFRVRRSW
jgi:hypothetical protein